MNAFVRSTKRSGAASIAVPPGLLSSVPTKKPLSPTLLIVYALLLALGLGLGSAFVVLSGEPPFGRVQLGPWMTWPRLGSPEADPYMRAIRSRRADVPLATGEGLELKADIDSEGQRLTSTCTYRVGSTMPAARLWTLTLYDEAGRLASSALGRSGFTSAEILRDAQDGFAIVLSRDLQAGNWLQLPSSGSFSIVLRLYDPPGAAGAVLNARNFPSITRVECAS